MFFPAGFCQSGAGRGGWRVENHEDALCQVEGVEGVCEGGTVMSHGIYADEDRDVRTLVSSEEMVEQINRSLNGRGIVAGRGKWAGKIGGITLSEGYLKLRF